MQCAHPANEVRTPPADPLIQTQNSKSISLSSYSKQPEYILKLQDLSEKINDSISEKYFDELDKLIFQNQSKEGEIPEKDFNSINEKTFEALLCYNFRLVEMEDIKKHYQLTKILKRNVERIYPNNELKHVLVKFHMAKSLKDFQDNYSQALTLFQEADKQLEKIGMQDSKISLQIKFFIGNLYDDLNQSEESIKILNYVLTKQILVYGEDHSLTGRTYNCLGIAEENRSNLKIAREYYQRSYQIFKKIFGGIETIDSAKAMNNLAGIFYKWENYNVCLNLYKKVLEIYKNS